MRISFGGATLDTSTRQLLRGTTEVPLSPKAFELLTLLVDQRPRALSKGELQERLWPDTYVSESSLAGLVAEIRRALDDDARSPRFVRTVSRFGYAFAGDVDGAAPRLEDPSRTRWWIVFADRLLPLKPGENILGRDPDLGGFESITVSRRHARIVVDDAQVTIEDLGSKNGTYVRGKRLESVQDLKDGDEIALGSLVVTFRASTLAESTQTWRR